jgi:natural product precursor
MKTKKFHKKLVLNKKTISNLKDKEMRVVGGGFTIGSCAYTCPLCDTFLKTCFRCPDIQTEYETCYTGWCC